MKVENNHVWVQYHQSWYARFDSYLQKLGFLKSDVDSNLYFSVVENQPLVLFLYGDDLFLTREEILIGQCYRDLTS